MTYQLIGRQRFARKGLDGVDLVDLVDRRMRLSLY